MSYKLFQNVFALSKEKSLWDITRKEWYVTHIQYIPEGTCLCNHYPITERIHMRNLYTLSNIIVGNCCINKFFGIMSYNRMFKAISKNKINADLINYAYEKNIINQKSFEFAIKVWKKRFKTFKQRQWFEDIREKILKEVKKDGNKCN